MMDRRVRGFIGHLIMPPLAVIVFIVRGCYGLFYGWWGEKRYNAKQQEKLEQQILAEFSFLFHDRNGRVVPNQIDNHMLTGWPVVTVSVDGLLVCFIKWRDERRVLIASERVPNDWHDLSKVLNVVEPDEARDHSFASFETAATVLNRGWALVKEAFSPEQYPEVKNQLQRDHRQAMAATRLMGREMNRRLYPDR